MSAIVSCQLSVFWPEEKDEMADFAAKLTREWSLEKLGYDLTVRDDDRDRYSGFYTHDLGVGWYDFYGSGVTDHIPCGDFVKRITDRFPSMALIESRTAEGQTDAVSVYLDGKWSEVKPANID